MVADKRKKRQLLISHIYRVCNEVYPCAHKAGQVCFPTRTFMNYYLGLS